MTSSEDAIVKIEANLTLFLSNTQLCSIHYVGIAVIHQTVICCRTELPRFRSFFLVCILFCLHDKKDRVPSVICAISKFSLTLTQIHQCPLHQYTTNLKKSHNLPQLSLQCHPVQLAESLYSFSHSQLYDIQPTNHLGYRGSS